MVKFLILNFVMTLNYYLQVENFTVSFSDGRALCYLIHHYHPCVLTRDMIEQETTVTCGKDKDDDDIDDDLIYENWTNCFSPCE